MSPCRREGGCVNSSHCHVILARVSQQSQARRRPGASVSTADCAAVASLQSLCRRCAWRGASLAGWSLFAESSAESSAEHMSKRKLASAQPDAPRQLRELRGVGAATLRDLARLGVTSVEQLASQSHTALYARLNEDYKAVRARGEYVGVPGLGPELDACVLDTLECAVAQARDPALPPEERNWWWYSRRRKAALRRQRRGVACEQRSALHAVHPVRAPRRRPDWRTAAVEGHADARASNATAKHAPSRPR